MPEAFRCLVLGGSGALGRVVCRLLAPFDPQLTFTYHTREAVAKSLTSELPGSRAVRLDVTDVPALERTVAEVTESRGGLDAFVHCAALGVSPGDPVPEEGHQTIDDVSLAGWDTLHAVNVRSVFFAVRGVARAMRSDGGNIVLLGSLGGVKPLPSPVHYAASKGALAGMTQALGKELGRYNIRVNLIAPGLMEDGMSRVLPRGLIDEYMKHCGLKRLGRLEEIGCVVAWLARHNTYVTGQTILVDGAS